MVRLPPAAIGVRVTAKGEVGNVGDKPVKEEERAPEASGAGDQMGCQSAVCIGVPFTDVWIVVVVGAQPGV